MRDDGDNLPLLARAMSLLISRKRFKELETDGVICESKEGENFRTLCNWMMILCFDLYLSLRVWGQEEDDKSRGWAKKNPKQTKPIGPKPIQTELKSISNHWIDDFPNPNRKTDVFCNYLN